MVIRASFVKRPLGHIFLLSVRTVYPSCVFLADTFSLTLNPYIELVLSLNIYVDGSKTKKEADAGIYSPELELKLQLVLGEIAIVFQAEIRATLHGADQILAGDFILMVKAFEAFNSYRIISCLILQCYKVWKRLVWIMT